MSKRRGQGKERLCTPGLGGGGPGPGPGDCEPSEIMYVVCNYKGVSRRRGRGKERLCAPVIIKVCLGVGGEARGRSASVLL